MQRDVYHHLQIRAVPAPGVDADWLLRCLADARAGFLQRMALTSSRLRARGLRMRLRAEPTVPLPAVRGDDRMGVALQLVRVDEGLRFRESVYRIDDAWLPLWQGHSRLAVEAADTPIPLPLDLRRELEPWLGIVRGTVPVAAWSEPASAGTN